MPQNNAENVRHGSNGAKSSNTAPKLPKRPPGRPFVKGEDPRRNLNGRPRSFDAVHALAQRLAREKVGSGELAITDLLRSWRDSDEPVLQKAFVEYAFGKVPDKIESTGLENKTTLVLHWPHERKDLTASPSNGQSNGRG